MAKATRALGGNDMAKPARTGGRTTALDLLRSNGYVIFDSLLPETMVDQVCDELEPWFAATPRCQGDFYGWSTARFGSVLLKSRTSHALARAHAVHHG